MRAASHCGWTWLALAAAIAFATSPAGAQQPAVVPGPDGKLVYASDERGNRIPDFSNCGYTGADRDIPDVPSVATVSPAAGDNTARIQSAINQIAAMPLRSDGFRGAVELAPGEFQVAGQLRISASGIVLRGSGAGEGGTTLLVTGTDRRAVVRVVGVGVGVGVGDKGLAQKPSTVIDEYVPVGSRQLRLSSVSGYPVGTRVEITRPSTREWIETIDANTFGVGWRPGSRDLVWDRIITAVDGNSVTLDAPITTAIDKRFGGARIAPTEQTGPIQNVGIEDVRLVSQPATNKPLDEDHAWHGITTENAKNAWVRRVEFEGFAGGAVALWESTKWVTVEDCISLAPISENGGFRRHAFFTQGQLTLFLRCWSEQGRHDFAVGHCAPGPNAFVNCRSRESLADSGPLESWASGVLYDNVRIDGSALNLVNRWTDPPGTGWSAANCVLWQCRAAKIACFRPPTANNWAIGCWAQFSGDGTFESPSDFVRPLSLYQAQLRERVGDAAAKRVGPILGEPIGATNPSIEEAARFAARSGERARELVDVIRERIEGHTKPIQGGLESGTGAANTPLLPAPSPQPLRLNNGWLVVGDRLVTGGRFDPLWWRGHVRADDVQQFGQNISRFVPGRVGTGFTDDLAQVADAMIERGQVAYDHHYGLWYERRRDDHTMGRQADGNVAAPFYEQPFARTGDPSRGMAWDGLTKYDLTKFNPWYWNRLRDFARMCDERGLVLLHQNYFQHNILEAGAHWADSPWRPANNINETGLPEPPPYIGDKRLFMAPAFYDVSNPMLRELHRGYIRQCLENFSGTSNAIQMTSAEYSGPLEFTQFWLDTVIEWERESGRDVVVGLSAPKDVQDAILADPELAHHIDVIDIRYWSYTADGLYAPKGGQNLAPRQHLRQTRQKPGGAAAVVKAVREYRDRFPEKAVIYNAEENCPSRHDGWAALIAGGSLADVKLPAELAEITATTRPVDGVAVGENAWSLANDRADFLIYAADAPAELALHLPSSGRYRARWLDPASGKILAEEVVNAEPSLSLPAKSSVLWLSRQE